MSKSPSIHLCFRITEWKKGNQEATSLKDTLIEYCLHQIKLDRLGGESRETAGVRWTGMLMLCTPQLKYLQPCPTQGKCILHTAFSIQLLAILIACVSPRGTIHSSHPDCCVIVQWKWYFKRLRRNLTCRGTRGQTQVHSKDPDR